MRFNGKRRYKTKLCKNSNIKDRLPMCFKCHEIADIIIVSRVVTRGVWVHVVNDYEEREVEKKVMEEYYMCGMCGRTLKTW
jgi:hypothetical protein